jgi:hypothetical protein
MAARRCRSAVLSVLSWMTTGRDVRVSLFDSLKSVDLDLDLVLVFSVWDAANLDSWTSRSRSRRRGLAAAVAGNPSARLALAPGMYLCATAGRCALLVALVVIPGLTSSGN